MKDGKKNLAIIPTPCPKILDVVGTYIALRSEQTQKLYQSVWARWVSFCAAPFVGVDPYAATDEQAMLYAVMRREQVAPITVRRNCVILSGIYRYLHEEGKVGKNIFAATYQQVKKARAGEIRPSQPLTSQQVRRLLDAPDCYTREGKRDRCWLALMFCGFRLSEVRGFVLSDARATVQGNGYKVVAKSKAGHQQRRPVPCWCAERLAELIKQRWAEGAGDHDPLIVRYSPVGLHGSDIGPQLGPKWYQHWIRIWARRAGIKEPLSPHWGRCSCVCQLLEAGASYRDVQDITGHGSIDMVAWYDRRRREIDESAVNKLEYNK